MAYRDYIICPECECKLIYDGSDAIRENLEERWGDPKLSTYTVSILCPDCVGKLRARVAELEEVLEDVRDDLGEGLNISPAAKDAVLTALETKP